MSDKPTFDPAKPFEAVTQDKPAFDPNKSFESVDNQIQQPSASQPAPAPASSVRSVSLDRQLPYMSAQVEKTFTEHPELFSNPQARQAYYNQVLKPYGYSDSPDYNKVYSALEQGDPYHQQHLKQLSEDLNSGKFPYHALDPIPEVTGALSIAGKQVASGVKTIAETGMGGGFYPSPTQSLHLFSGATKIGFGVLSAINPEVAAFNLASEGIEEKNPGATDILSPISKNLEKKYAEAGIKPPAWKSDLAEIGDLGIFMGAMMGIHGLPKVAGKISDRVAINDFNKGLDELTPDQINEIYNKEQAAKQQYYQETGQVKGGPVTVGFNDWLNNLKAKAKQEGEKQQTDLNRALARKTVPSHFNELDQVSLSKPISQLPDGLNVNYQGDDGHISRDAQTNEILFTSESGKKQILGGGGDDRSAGEVGITINEGKYADTNGKYFVEKTADGHTIYRVNKNGDLKPMYEGDNANQERRDAIIKKAMERSNDEASIYDLSKRKDKIQADILTTVNPTVAAVLSDKSAAIDEQLSALHEKLAEENSVRASNGAALSVFESQKQELESGMDGLSTESKQELRPEVEKLKGHIKNLKDHAIQVEKIDEQEKNTNLAPHEHADLLDRLPEQDNPEQESDVASIESAANSDQPNELADALKRSKAIIQQHEGNVVAAKPLAELFTDEDRFQGRGDKFSKESVVNIIGNYDASSMNPILYWRDPAGNDFVLAGHSRRFALNLLSKMADGEQLSVEEQRLVDTAKKEFSVTEQQMIDKATKEGFQPGVAPESKEFKGSEQEAIDKAEASNARASMQKPVENAGILREMRARGAMATELDKKLRELSPRGDRKFTENVSYLSKGGSVLADLKAFSDSGDRTTQKHVEKVADWIGETRREISALTDEHEKEMYDFLSGDTAIKRKGEFVAKVQTKSFGLQDGEPLNLKGLDNAGKSQNRIDWETRRDELKTSVREQKSKLAPDKETGWNQIKKEMVAGLAKGTSDAELSAAENKFNSASVQKAYQEKVEKAKSDLQRSQDELQKHLLKEGDLISGDKAQVSMFEEAAAFIRKGKIGDDIAMAGVPFAKQVWNGALEIMAQTIETGGKLADAIQKGLDHIRDSQWYKNLKSRTDQKNAEEKFLEYAKSVELNTRVNPNKGREVTKVEIEKILADIKESEPAFKEQLRQAAKGNILSRIALSTTKIFHPFIGGTKSTPSIYTDTRLTAMILREKIGEMQHNNEIAAQGSLERELFFDKHVDAADQIRFMANQERGITSFGSNKLDALAKENRIAMDQVYDQISRIKDLPYIEDYIPHFWKDPEKARQIFSAIYSKRPIEGSKSFLKQRFYADIIEGMKNGLELVSTNPEVNKRLAQINANKFTMGNDFFDALRERGLVKYFEEGKVADSGWSKVDDPLFNAKLISDKLKGGGWYMPEDAADIVRRYTSRGILKGDVFNVIRNYNNVLNQAQLGISFFHGMTTTIDAGVTANAIGLDRISRGLIGPGLWNIAKGTLLIPNMIDQIRIGNHGIKDYRSGVVNEVVRQMIVANAKTGMDVIYHTNMSDNFKRALAKGNYGEALLRAVPAIFDVAAKPIFEYVVPRLKVGGFIKLAENELSKLKNTTPDEIDRTIQRSWDDIENRLGQMTYDNLFWDKTTKDIAFLITRSVGWNLGTARAFAGAIKDIPSSAVSLAKGKGISPRTSWAIALVGQTALMGAITNYLSTGESPQDWRDYFYPRTGEKNKDGAAKRIQYPTYMKEVFNTYERGLYHTAIAKASPFVNEVGEIMENKDFYGEQVYDPLDPAYKRGLETLQYLGTQFIPFGFRNIPGEEQSTAESVRKKFGLMPAPMQVQTGIDKSAIYNKIEKINSNLEDLKKKLRYKKISPDAYDKRYEELQQMKQTEFMLFHFNEPEPVPVESSHERKQGTRK